MMIKLPQYVVRCREGSWIGEGRFAAVYGALSRLEDPHSRHKVRLFTLHQGAWGVRSVLAEHQSAHGRPLASTGKCLGRRRARSRYLRIKMITTNLESQAKRV